MTKWDIHQFPERLSWPDIAYLAVRPKWVRYSDFDQNPPYIEEFIFEPGSSVTRHSAAATDISRPMLNPVFLKDSE